MGFRSSSGPNAPGWNDQSRACASGFRRAFAKFSSAILARCAWSSPQRSAYASATWLNRCGQGNFAASASRPTQAAEPRCSAAAAPPTLRISSTPVTNATSYRPASSSAMAASSATLPDAHAASCRAVGSSPNAGCALFTKPPSCAWPANSSPARFPTCATSTSSAGTPVAASTPSTDASTSSNSPSDFSAKSVWNPPRMCTVTGRPLVATPAARV